METPCPTCGSGILATDRFCGECGNRLGGDTESEGLEPVTGRRVVSVLFADLAGYTSFAEDRDPEEVRSFLGEYFATVRQVITRFGGRLEKFIGDAVMAVWGTPVAQEDDAERSVRAGLDLVDTVAKLSSAAGIPEVQLRVGVLTGETAVGSGAGGAALVVGDLVNTASRLQAVAEPGTVVVGEATYRSTRRAIDHESLGEQLLKGKSQPTAMWQAIRVVGRRRGAGRPEGVEPPFVGRKHELRLLKDLLESTMRDRRARLVSVVGLVGVGKSRLVWELAKFTDGMVDDVYWHEGRSPSYEEAVPYWALGEMIRQRAGIGEGEAAPLAREKLLATLREFVPDAVERSRLEPSLAGLLGLEEVPGGSRFELHHAFRSFFQRVSEKAPAVLVFEDLHWADAGLLDFIEELPQWSRGGPILVVTLARPELLERRPAWGSGRPDFTSFHLGPLSAGDMEELVYGMVPGTAPEAVAAVLERAAGIPLYAVELVRMLLSEGRLVPEADGYSLVGGAEDLPVPESLHAVIGARLDRLGPELSQVVDSAAVIGDVFTEDALVAVTGLDLESVTQRLDQLVRREIVELRRSPGSLRPSGYAFVQGLIGEIAYARLPLGVRHQRHLAAAAYLESLDDETIAGIAASQYISADRAAAALGDREPTADASRSALVEAAERAAALHAHGEALRLAQLAIQAGAEPKGGMLELAAASAHALGESERADEIASQAVDIWRAGSDRGGELRALTLRGRIAIEDQAAQRAVALLAPVMEQSAAEFEPEMLDVAAEFARALVLIDDPDQALEVADRALPVAERLYRMTLVGHLLNTKGTAFVIQGRNAEGVALLQGSLDVATRFGPVVGELRGLANLHYAVSADDPRQTVAILRTGLERSEEVGEATFELFFLRQLMETLVRIGEVDDAAALLDHPQLATDRGQDVAELVRGSIDALRGDLGTAVGRFERLSQQSTEMDPQWRRGEESMQPFIELTAGHLEAAVDGSLRIFDADPTSHFGLALLAADASLLLGDAGLMAMAAEALDRVPARGRVVDAGRLGIAAGRAALDGDLDEAARAFQQAIELWRQIDNPWQLACCLVAAARLLPDHPLSAGRHEEAERLFAAMGGPTLIGRLTGVSSVDLYAISGSSRRILNGRTRARRGL